MKTNWVILIVFALLMAEGSVPAVTNDLSGALQRGLFEEEANHNLEAAIQAYQAVINQYDKDRKLAATAVFRLAESYRKQGKTNEANAQYQRVLRDFTDQSELTRLSQQNLDALGISSDLSSASANRARLEQKRLLGDEIRLAENDLAAEKKRRENGTATDETVRAAERTVLQLRRQLAALDSVPLAQDPSSQAGTVPLTSGEAEEVKRIQAMIKNSPDLINARSTGSGTPLHRAAAAGQLVVAEFLLRNGAEVEAKDDHGRTPLRNAAAAGQKAMAELLLKYKASPQNADDMLYTPLHLAAERGMRSVAELLITSGADMNAKTHMNATPLHLAIANSFDSVVALLIDRGADLDVVAGKNFNGTPLHVAISRGNKSIIALLLAKKAKLKVFNPAGETPLHVAAQMGDDGLVKQLLAHGADVNEKSLSGLTALAYGLSKKEVVAILLENKADPNAKFDTGPSPTEKGITPLVKAAWSCWSEVLELLLQNNADPNLATDSGRTAILEAIQTSASSNDQRKRMTQLLLEHGADANSRDRERATPLMWAVFKGDKSIVELLLAHKADVNAKSSSGESPLHSAALSLQKGGGSSVGDIIPIVELLIASGADVNARNNEGATPLKLAGTTKSQNAERMAALLRQHGALEDLPLPDVIQVRRPSANFSDIPLRKSTNDWNRFTVLEVIAMEYGLLTRIPQGESPTSSDGKGWASIQPMLAFPNLEKVRIRRPAPDLKSWQTQTVDLSSVISSGDCSKDVATQWGDVVEVSEADHPLNESWPGFSTNEWSNLKNCLSRNVEIIVKGQRKKVTLAPEIDLRAVRPRHLSGTSDEKPAPTLVVVIQTATPFWIKPALRKTNLLLASSDLAHVRVKRVDPVTGLKREWLLDCSDSKPAPDFWLRDGDVIEVPDKS